MPIRRIHEQGSIENIADTRRPEARENSAFLLLRLGCAAAFLVIVLCSAYVIAGDKHEIWGRVYSEVTGEGIEDLQIYCSTWGDVGPRGTTGADGLFIESHPDPANAKSDASTMLQLDLLRGILEKVVKVRKALHS